MFVQTSVAVCTRVWYCILQKHKFRNLVVYIFKQIVLESNIYIGEFEYDRWCSTLIDLAVLSSGTFSSLSGLKLRTVLSIVNKVTNSNCQMSVKPCINWPHVRREESSDKVHVQLRIKNCKQRTNEENPMKNDRKSFPAADLLLWLASNFFWFYNCRSAEHRNPCTFAIERTHNNSPDLSPRQIWV